MSVYAEKKAGVLTGRFRAEVQHNGNRAKRAFGSHAEAVAWERDLLSKLAANGALEAPQVAPRAIVAEEHSYTFYKCYSKADGKLWKGNSFEASSLAMVRLCMELFGDDRPIDGIGLADVDDLIEALEAKGRSGATLNHYMKALGSFLKWCHARGYRKAPLFKMEHRELDEGRIRWITPEEEAYLLAFRNNHAPWFGDLVKVGIETGMRRSEILTLDPGQVEAEWVRLWKTKSKSPRSVPIDVETRERLKRLLKNGMPTQHMLRGEWSKARKEMGLEADPWFVFHATRHTCATRLVNANVNLRVIQKFMGHKNIETTIRYAHVQDETLADALVKRKGYVPPSSSPSSPAEGTL